MANFSLLAKLGLDTKAFQTGLKGAETRMGKFKKMAAKLGPVLGGIGLAKLAMDAINLGSKISDMAVQLRISAEALQVLEFAARKAGVQTSIMERAIRNVQLRTQQGIEGNKRYAEAYDTLGLSIDEVNKLPAEQKLEAIGKAFKDAEDKNAAYNAVAAVLGERAGPMMMEILDDLATKGFPALSRAAKDAGEVMSDELIAEMDEAADKLESLKRRGTVLSANVLGVIIPALEVFAGVLKAVSLTVASLTSKIMVFGRFLSETLGSVIQPAILSFKALGLGIKGAILAIKGEFGAADQAIQEAANSGKQAFEELKNIPSEIAASYKAANEDMQNVNRSMEKDYEKTTKKIANSFDELFGGTVKKSKKAGEEIKDNLVGEETTPEATPEETPEETPDAKPDTKPEDTRGDFARELTGEELRKAASKAKDGVRFERMADGTFQQFTNGKKGGRFTEEQLQAGLEKQVESDPSQKTLESIEKILEGKFVNE